MTTPDVAPSDQSGWLNQFIGGPDWHKDALCRKVPNADLFFPSRRSPNLERAIAICASCPVLESCRIFAAETAQSYGVWAGEFLG